MEERRAWWKEAVVYQIYPRSFADSNGDGIGDLNGITEHLPYLRTLGIDVIWLSPVYRSPNDDNGYDISDYREIMDEFGTMEDFDRLLAGAHELGMRIIMDLVVNHTSDEHPWFVESRKSADSAFRDFYIWREPADGRAPNNWESCFSGSAWELDEATGMYYLHCFSRKQPDLNWANPEVREAVYDMMEWWCRKGIDGFRMDAISMISKDPEYPDGISADGIYGDMTPYVYNRPEVHEYLREMNRRVLSRYDIMTVGEAARVKIDDALRYANSGGTELDMVFQFEHVKSRVRDRRAGKWITYAPTLPEVREILNRWQTETEGKAWNALFIDNHDLPRCVSRYGNDSEKWRALSAKMLATCIHMMKGTPYIYQGEELGMTNRDWGSIDDCRDVEEINAYRQYVEERRSISSAEMLKCFGEIGRDNARTPMQWNAGPGAGFTEGTPWIGLNPNYTEINAEREMADPDSVFHYYRRLIGLRHSLPVVVYGRFEALLTDDPCVYAYRRILDGSVMTVACSWSENPAACTLFDGLEGRELISNYGSHLPGKLQPYEARVILEEIPQR